MGICNTFHCICWSPGCWYGEAEAVKKLRLSTRLWRESLGIIILLFRSHENSYNIELKSQFDGCHVAIAGMLVSCSCHRGGCHVAVIERHIRPVMLNFPQYIYVRSVT